MITSVASRPWRLSPSGPAQTELARAPGCTPDAAAVPCEARFGVELNLPAPYVRVPAQAPRGCPVLLAQEAIHFVKGSLILGFAH